MKRRDFLQSAAFGTALFTTPGLFAEQLAPTPRMTEGPFYPDHMPLDTDNDLIILNDALTPAAGEITHLSGRILSRSGEPVRNAFVEIWQVDHAGAYLHSGTSNAEKRDGNFQGYGRFLTDSTGRYYFRTIKPVPYPGRTPHIHFAISKSGQRVLTSQLFVKGHPENQRDGIFQRLENAAAVDAVTKEFKPIEDSPIGELAVEFDLVLGVTPQEGEDGQLGIGKPEWQSRRPSGARGRR